MVRTVLSSRFAVSSPKAFVHTYGCQGNVADSERIKGMLREMGYEFVDVPEKADLVLYNTCAVREHAEDRVFGNVGALKQFKKTNSEFKIVLCGCMMQQKHIAEKIRKSFSFVDMVFGTNAMHKFPELMYRMLCNEKRVFDIDDEKGVIAEGIPLVRDSSVKAWLPIMYGCNNFCSYCIVPYVRGRERSRNPETIINEAKELVKKGYKDITLLGQNVNSYGKDFEEPYPFAKLLREINAIEGDFRIRFMTSHPKDCTFELLDTMAECEKVSKHLHLPFQSGNDRVLKEMNRHYDRAKYLELIAYAKKKMPDLSITSDVIVGFPGETYEEFKDTLSLVKEVEYSSLFTFIYSAREGTPAAKMPDPVSREEKGKWFKELTDLQEKIATERNLKMKDKIYRVFVEGKAEDKKLPDDYLSGRTDGNIIIEFRGSDELINTFVDVRVTEPLTWILRGELVK
ncbi:MAG: tRNA (N6-isopentenyl adenosine(37)-C2)-methylthiotransferase MiaB [Clostridiales bacterium]|nr:tRNA (N6-isopentenyl adenosine(37)-C2)-methylthiotransferase MiaB [Clostridiales bacterium]